MRGIARRPELEAFLLDRSPSHGLPWAHHRHRRGRQAEQHPGGSFRQDHEVLGEPGRPRVTVYDQNTGSNPVHLATSGP